MYPPRDLAGFLSFLMLNVCFLTIHYTFILPPSKYMVSIHFFYVVVQEKILFVDIKKNLLRKLPCIIYWQSHATILSTLHC